MRKGLALLSSILATSLMSVAALAVDVGVNITEATTTTTTTTLAPVTPPMSVASMLTGLGSGVGNIVSNISLPYITLLILLSFAVALGIFFLGASEKIARG